jgi:hypothetical protein
LRGRSAPSAQGAKRLSSWIEGLQGEQGAWHEQLVGRKAPEQLRGCKAHSAHDMSWLGAQAHRAQGARVGWVGLLW